MASTFDRVRFGSRLTTRRLGRTLLARAVAGSTNDEAWDALAGDAPDGAIVVADAQTQIGSFRQGTSSALQVGDHLVVIGDPNAQGQIVAKFIRILP